MLTRRLLSLGAGCALLTASGAMAQDVIWDSPPNNDLPAFVDQQFSPANAAFSTFLVGHVRLDRPYFIHDIRTYFTFAGGVWPIGDIEAVLNIIPQDQDLPPNNYNPAGPQENGDGRKVLATLAQNGDRLTLTTSVNGDLLLEPGNYWIGLTPKISFVDFGQEFHKGTDQWLKNSAGRNPGGGFQVGPDWFDAGQTFAGIDWGMAIQITGKNADEPPDCNRVIEKLDRGISKISRGIEKLEFLLANPDLPPEERAVIIQEVIDQIRDTIAQLEEAIAQLIAIQQAGGEGCPPGIDYDRILNKLDRAIGKLTRAIEKLEFLLEFPDLPPSVIAQVISDVIDQLEGTIKQLEDAIRQLQGLPVCPWDLDNNGSVGATDLLSLLVNWGPCDDCNDCKPDFDGNCSVGATDLLALLVNWGPCPGGGNECPGDICGEFKECGFGEPFNCFCWTLADGSGICLQNFLCADVFPCDGEDCPPGFVCVFESCCGDAFCVPIIKCEDGAAPGGATPGTGPSGSGQFIEATQSAPTRPQNIGTTPRIRFSDTP